MKKLENKKTLIGTVCAILLVLLGAIAAWKLISQNELTDVTYCINNVGCKQTTVRGYKGIYDEETCVSRGGKVIMTGMGSFGACVPKA